MIRPPMSPSRQRGIALILVMWVLTLLTVMAVSVTATQKSELTLTENAVESARLRALADAALAYTALDFLTLNRQLDGQDVALWLPDSTPHIWTFAGQRLRIRVSNEMSRINLNQASPQLLARLFAALAVPEEQAKALAHAIVDWRDADDLRMLQGAEADDYRAAGRSLGPRNAPFESVAELRGLLGMTPALYRRVAPLLTTSIRAPRVVEDFAAAPVLSAVRAIPLEQAETIAAKRASGLLPGGALATATNRGGPLYRVEIGQLDARGRPLATGRLEALLELRHGQQPPYWVHWRRYLERADGLADSRPAADR